jgi:histidine triad (HIT) family protein
MADCIFCQIIKGELPCAKVYENERVISFLDANPINAGHTLVLPKRHYATLFEISEEDLYACTAASQTIAMAVFKATKASGLNFFQNNYRPAGQRVDHIHFHLIPRFHQDSFWNSWPSKPYPQGEAGEVLKKIKAEL